MSISKDSRITIDRVGNTELYLDNKLILHKEGQVINLEGVSSQDAKQLSSILKKYNCQVMAEQHNIKW